MLNLKVSDVIPTPDNPRKIDVNSDDFAELKESISKFGQTVAIICRPHPVLKGKYDLRSGARRLTALKQLGIKTVLADVREMTDQEAMDVTYTENIARKDLTNFELAHGVDCLLKAYNNDIKAVSSRFGKSEIWVRMMSAVGKMPTEWRSSKKPQVLALSPAHLSEIARYPKNIQLAILKELGNYFENDKLGQSYPFPIKKFCAELKKYSLEIKAFPWDQKKCDGCPNRSDSKIQTALWIEPSAKSKISLCLDRHCYVSQFKEFMVGRIDAMKKQKLVPYVFGKRVQYELLQELESIGAVMAQDFEWKVVKKNSPGSREAISIDESDGTLGKCVYIAKVLDEDAPEKETVDRKQLLTMKRLKWILEKLVKHITDNGIPIDKIWGFKDDKETSTVMALALRFGTWERSQNAEKAGWDDITKICNEPANSIAQRLLTAIKPTICNRLTWTGPISQIPPEYRNEAEEVATRLLGMNYDDLIKESEAAIPEPKSWTKG